MIPVKLRVRVIESVEVPAVARRIVIPIVYIVGSILGKYRQFEHAPAPIPPNRGARASAPAGPNRTT